MEEFILEEATPVSGQGSYVQHCAHCQALMTEVRQEQEAWSQALYPERLTEEFTRQVMTSLADVPIEPAAEEDEPDTIVLRKRVRSPFIRRAALAAACLLIIAAALTLYAQPSIADWVRSIFARDNVASDSGLLDARKLGLVQNPHIKVKDKGYTLEIDEVVVDPIRIIMGVKITDPHGKPVVNEVDWSQVTVKDTEGREVAKLHPLGGSAVIENVWSLLSDGVQSDTLTVEGKINQIGNEYFSKRIVKGHWNFKFTLDMKQASALTRVTPLDQKYTTPDGLHLQMEKLVRTPSGVRLELSTSLDEKAKSRSSGLPWEKQELAFHFEDEQGNIISSVDGDGTGPTYAMGMPQRVVKSDQVRWSYTFTYLPYDQKKLRFVLDNYTIPIHSDGAISFTPQDVNDHPVTFKDQGDMIRLSGFQIGQDPNYQEKKVAGLISMTGTFTNGFNQDEWVLRDQDGNEYPIDFRGAVQMGKIREADGDPGFIVEGLTALPEKATLIRKVTDKWYNNINWSFELPKGEPIKGLENVNPEDYWEAP
ncbi:hypothetical protein CJP46_24380 [Paenibacillus sp. XY044]|nr:hypothetical protein CJP46_24380 [Paenibacillus sp. XY044]